MNHAYSKFIQKFIVDGFEKALAEINFPDYKNVGSLNDAYSKFIQKLMEVIDKVTPGLSKIKESKGILKNGLITRFQNKIIICYKLFKRYKKIYASCR